MSLQQTLEYLGETPQHRDFRHELFELCMSQVDAGELTLADVPSSIARLETYFSNVGGHAAVAESVDVSAVTPRVTTAVIERASAR